ncbi:MAG: archease [Syntrophales bacterium]|nr:archease [Syntrophales bacterium]
MKRYRVFDHTADLGVEIYGKTVEELFVNAAFAIFDLMTDLQDVKITEVRAIVTEGADWEDLLVNYLRDVLYLFNGEGLILSDYAIAEINPHHLMGEVRGEPFEPNRHRIKTEIKAVTYHQALIRENGEGWVGRVVFDV